MRMEMWRTFWLAAIVVALVTTVPNLSDAAIIHGIGPSILVLLVNLGAYFLAVRRACFERTRGIIGAALLAGVDVGSLAGLLTCVLYLIMRYKQTGLQSVLTQSIALILGTLFLGVLCSLVMGMIITIIRSGGSKKIAESEIPLPQSIFVHRHLATYIPFAACLIWTAVAGIILGSLPRNPKAQNVDINAILNAGPKVGALAPPIVSTTIAGRPWRLADQRGKVVVLDFWATWCKPCINSMPMLERIQKEYGGRSDFAMASVSIDQDRSALETFLKTHEVHSLILFENDAGPKNSVARQFEVTAVPSLWIVNKSGYIAAKHVFEEAALKSKIAESLAEHPR